MLTLLIDKKKFGFGFHMYGKALILQSIKLLHKFFETLDPDHKLYPVYLPFLQSKKSLEIMVLENDLCQIEHFSESFGRKVYL